MVSMEKVDQNRKRGGQVPFVFYFFFISNNAKNGSGRNHVYNFPKILHSFPLCFRFKFFIDSLSLHRKKNQVSSPSAIQSRMRKCFKFFFWIIFQ